MNRRRTAWLSLAALAIAAAPFAGRPLLRAAESREAHYTDKLARHLREEQGLIGLLTMDAGELREQLSGRPCRNRRTLIEPGRIGEARRFDGSDRCYIQTPVAWSELGNRYTLGCWVNLSAEALRQCLIFSQDGTVKGGLFLENGRMVFRVPGGERAQEVAYPFEAFGRFVFLAGVADLEAGEARLYEDGVLKATAPIAEVRQPSGLIEIGKMRALKVSAPLHGAVDETAFWSRPLAAEEIERLARVRVTWPAAFDRGCYVKGRLATAAAEAARAVRGWAEAFDPRREPAALWRSGLPTLDLILSKGDERHFVRRHNRCVRNGYFVRDAGERRKAEAVDGAAEVHAVSVALYGDRDAYPPTRRRSLVVEGENGATVLGLPRVRLVPPERENGLGRILASRLAARQGSEAPASGLCLLAVNGELAGVYAYEDFSREAVTPGREAAGSAGHLLDGIALPDGMIRAEWERLSAETLPLLVRDRASGLARAQVRAMAESVREDLEATLVRRGEEGGALPRAMDALDAYAVMGANRSPFRITRDLRLDALRIPGLNLAWTSSAPEILDAAGHVRQPAGTRPLIVTMEAEARLGAETAHKALRFRVMPREERLPSVFFTIRGEVDNLSRAPSAMEWLDTGATNAVLGYGRIKYRGNTMLLMEKKSYSFKARDRHGMPGFSESPYLYFMSCAADRSFMKNSLSYGLFRSFESPGAPRFAPRLRIVEVYVNGDYRGIYEMGERVDRSLVGWPEWDPEHFDRRAMYKAVGGIANFRTPERDAYVQEEPPVETGPHWGAYDRLIRFIGTASPEEFRAHIGEVMDLANVADHQLLLNLSNNGDGQNHNLFLVRDPSGDGRFYLVPWDYDKTFGKHDDTRLTNHLLDRLLGEVPEYRALLKARWAELRKAQLGESALMERLEELERPLRDYAAFNYERWNTPEKELAPLSAEIREWIPRRLAYMDAWIGGL